MPVGQIRRRKMERALGVPRYSIGSCANKDWGRQMHSTKHEGSVYKSVHSIGMFNKNKHDSPHERPIMSRHNSVESSNCDKTRKEDTIYGTGSLFYILCGI
jgi:hypothetical protein